MATQITTQVSIGDNIRRLRAASGRTKTDLCSEIGMSRAYWDSVEKGMCDPSVSTLTRIAGVFEVDVADLLQATGPKRRKAS